MSSLQRQLPGIAKTFGFLLLLAGAVCAQHRGVRTHGRPGEPNHETAPRHEFSDRNDFVELRDRDRRFFFHDGHFYRRHGPYFFFTLDAPFGVVVPFLPFGAIELRAGPVFYYYYEGIYYEPAPTGYVVVAKPPVVMVPEEEGKANSQPFKEPEADTVMIHNSNGSKTPVRLEKDDDKWRGPQGELYDSLPKEDQLRSEYGF